MEELEAGDCIPKGLGIKVVANYEGRTFSEILPKYTSYPCKVTKENYTTSADNAKFVSISIYEGDHMHVEKNSLLDQFRLAVPPEMKKGEPKIDVTMEFTNSGILTVTAIEKSGGTQGQVSISRATESKKMYAEDVEQGMEILTNDVYYLDWRIRQRSVHPDLRKELGRKLRPAFSFVHDMHGFGALQKADVEKYQQTANEIRESLESALQSRSSGMLMLPPQNKNTGRKSIDGRNN